MQSNTQDVKQDMTKEQSTKAQNTPKMVEETLNMAQDKSIGEKNKSDILQNKQDLVQDKLNVASNKLNLTQNSQKQPQDKQNNVQNNQKQGQNKSNNAQDELNMIQDKSNLKQNKQKQGQHKSNITQDKLTITKDQLNMSQNKLNIALFQEYKNFNKKNYQACMLLAAVGDAMGYKGGSWQFNTSGKLIHQQMMQITNGKGPCALKMDLSWRYSDDTVMHIATAEALLNVSKDAKIGEIAQNIAKEYKSCWKKMSGRAPGNTCGKFIKKLEEDGSNWFKIPYNEWGCGCGASMRAACIGLAYCHDDLNIIAVGIQSGRITHHNPVGYLGSLVAAYFTALAIRGVEPKYWAASFFDKIQPLAKKYIQDDKRQVESNLGKKQGYWQKFYSSWQDYSKQRSISLTLKQSSEPKFPQLYGVTQRQHFYHKLSWNGWPGALGIDSVLIAYDALLSCKGIWQQICLRAVLHGGDSDSTGTIAGAWFGAYYGFQGVPQIHYKELESHKLLQILGSKLYKRLENNK